MKKQAGFTLIELVAVMVILAIMAIVAVPQFVDLRVDARRAATQGVAGALASAGALNFARRSVNSAQGFAVTNCTDLSAGLQGGVLPTADSGGVFTITAAPVAAGAQVTCTVVHPADATITATFSVVGMT